jgi:predicted lipid-binding transport protein (Tim44 family)
MSDGFAFFDIIIFAMLAGYLVFQLRRALGRRSDSQKPQAKAPAGANGNRDDPENVIAIKVNDNNVEKEKIGGLTELREKDPSFSDKDFTKGSKEAFSWIVEAFSKGDASKLEPLLSDPLFKSFKEVSIKSAQIHNVTLKGNQANIAVEYVSDQIKATRSKDDEVIEGDPDTIVTVTDLWTFSRDITSKNPNWVLVKTETPSEN